jgi:lipoprotein-anchoring transpeptidase ErfK/SrfK
MPSIVNRAEPRANGAPAMVSVMYKRSALYRLAASTCFAALLLGASGDLARANPPIYGAPAYQGGYYVPQQSALGGGLIEALVGGDSGPVRYATPPAAQAHPGNAHLAAYAPQSAEVHRAIDPMFMRAEVDYSGSEAPGTIVVDTPNKFLYYVHSRGRATRYGIGVGRPGFEWSGIKSVSRKAEWPDWTPPPEMLARRPDLPRHMEGGPANPLGARALYLGSSLYRIHGTNEPYTIGQNVSSGCIRMMNEDVVDLYDRVHVGARVVVR